MVRDRHAAEHAPAACLGQVLPRSNRPIGVWWVIWWARPRAEEHGQRRDERDDAQPGDRRPVDGAEKARPSVPAMKSRAPPWVAAADDRGRGQHRSDAQIDSAGGDDEGHADRDGAGHAGLDQQVPEVARREESPLGEHPDRDEQEDGHRQRGLLTPHAANQRATGALGRLGFFVLLRGALLGSSGTMRSEWRKISSLGHRVALDLGDQRALAHDQDAVAEAGQLRQLRGDDESRGPRRKLAMTR